MRILIIEDDLMMAGYVTDGFRREGFVCTHVKDGVEGLAAILQGGYDAAIMDRVWDYSFDPHTNVVEVRVTRFWRADTSRNQVGNGLGLALAKAIVTSYGGLIACRSELGCGSELTVMLPKRSS